MASKNDRKKRNKKTKSPDEMSHQEYREWRGEHNTASPKNFHKNADSLDSYQIKRKYGVVITEREIKPGMILTSREFIGIPPSKFKTLIEKEDDKLLKKVFSLERPKYYPSEVFLIIKKAKPEIDKLWHYIWKTYKNSQENKNEDRTDFEILKDTSLKWVRKNKPKTLKEEYFKDSFEDILKDEYPDEWGLKRNFIGKLLQKIISDNHPDIFPDLNRTPKHFGFKNLHDLYSEF